MRDGHVTGVQRCALPVVEIEDLVTVGDVAAVVQRLEMVRRISEEIEAYILELGDDGRLLQLQLDELIGGIGPDRELIVQDYLPETMKVEQEIGRASCRERVEIRVSAG